MSDIEKFCMICGRSEKYAGKMFQMPPSLTVCSDCLQRTMNQMGSFGSGSMGVDSDTMASIFKAYTGYGATDEADSLNRSDDGEASEVLEAEDVELESDDSETSDDKDTDEPKKGFGFGGIPNVQFLNWSDLQSIMRPGAQVKSKKKKHKEEIPIKSIADIPKPHVIKGMLDEYVVGQEHAKKVISVGVYNHYKRVLSENVKAADEENPDAVETDVQAKEIATEVAPTVEIEKSNMLMIGPTGCGKTYLVKTLAKLLNVPLAITDATSLTEAGYIGDDIESVVSKLLAEADNDVERAERGIIFIDEIDKIAKKKNSHARDVSGESVQQGMLKLLEGSDVDVPVGASSKNAMVPTTTVNTRNILFICGGAFPDLEDIIKKRLTKKSSIGYGASLKDEYDKDKNLLSKVTPDDLREFGMIPEFIGRLPIVFSLEGLSDEMMVRILREPKNAILRQYKKLLEMDEVDLQFTDEALSAIAKKAQEKETGARALRAIIEELMLDIMYEIPKDDNIGIVTITEDYVNGIGGPQITMRG